MRLLFSLLLLGFISNSAWPAPQYTLQDLIDIAKRENPILDVLKAKEDAARSTVITAESYLNPEIEAGSGPSKYRTPNSTANQKQNWGVTLSQPLEFPNVRSARKAVAESRVNYASSVTEATMINLSLQIKKAFYEVLQNEAVLKIAEGDRDALNDIRSRVGLRVEVGEAPRYELIKADTELIAAQRDADAAKLRIYESKLYLRGLVSKSLTDTFDVNGSLPPTDIALNADYLKEEINNNLNTISLQLSSYNNDNSSVTNNDLIINSLNNCNYAYSNYIISSNIYNNIKNIRNIEINSYIETAQLYSNASFENRNTIFNLYSTIISIL